MLRLFLIPPASPAPLSICLSVCLSLSLSASLSLPLCLSLFVSLSLSQCLLFSILLLSVPVSLCHRFKRYGHVDGDSVEKQGSGAQLTLLSDPNPIPQPPVQKKKKKRRKKRRSRTEDKESRKARVNYGRGSGVVEGGGWVGENPLWYVPSKDWKEVGAARRESWRSLRWRCRLTGLTDEPSEVLESRKSKSSDPTFNLLSPRISPATPGPHTERRK